MKVKGDTLLIIGALAVAAYVIWKAFDKIKDKANEIADDIAAPIADAWESVFLPDPVQVNASVRLPDGRMLDATVLHIVKTAGKEQFTFAYMGKTYELLPRTSQGYYSSKLLV